MLDFEMLSLKINENLKYRPYIHTLSSQESRRFKGIYKIPWLVFTGLSLTPLRV